MEDSQATHDYPNRFPNNDTDLTPDDDETRRVWIEAAEWRDHAEPGDSASQGVLVVDDDPQAGETLVEGPHGEHRTINRDAIFETTLDEGDRVVVSYDSNYSDDRVEKELTVAAVHRSYGDAFDGLVLEHDDGREYNVSTHGSVTTRGDTHRRIGDDAIVGLADADQNDDEDDATDAETFDELAEGDEFSVKGLRGEWIVETLDGRVAIAYKRDTPHFALEFRKSGAHVIPCELEDGDALEHGETLPANAEITIESRADDAHDPATDGGHDLELATDGGRDVDESPEYDEGERVIVNLELAGETRTGMVKRTRQVRGAGDSYTEYAVSLDGAGDAHVTVDRLTAVDAIGTADDRVEVDVDALTTIVSLAKARVDDDCAQYKTADEVPGYDVEDALDALEEIRDDVADSIEK